MSTTWGQYTWGSNSWESDLNTITPSSNTLSLTSGSLIAYPEQGWGGKQWGINEWGELSDVTVSLTGQSLTSTLGTETAEGILNTGWGRKNWGEESWGIGGSVIAPSFTLTTAVQSVIVTAEVNIGWGGLTWGSGDWGDLANPDVPLTTPNALQTTIASVSITANANVIPTGIENTITLQGAVGGTSVLIDNLTGLSATASEGNAFGGELVVVEVTSPAHDEWGTEYWGSGQWGVGDGVTILLGTETENIADANVEVSGSEVTFQAVGDTVIPVVIENGIEITSFVNDAFGGEVVEVQVTTASTQPWGETAWGDGQWGQSVGTDISQGGEEVAVPSVEVDVTGEELQTNTGQETVTADANITLTGLSLLDIQLGDEDAFTNVRVQVTGQELGPFIIGDFLAGISAEADPTGVTATISTGIMSVNAWAVVDAGDEPTWTVVDIAA